MSSTMETIINTRPVTNVKITEKIWATVWLLKKWESRYVQQMIAPPYPKNSRNVAPVRVTGQELVVTGQSVEMVTSHGMSAYSSFVFS